MPDAHAVPAYLVEGYSPSGTGESLNDLTERLDQAARTTPATARVRHIESSLVPDDEMSLCLLEGPSAEAVREVAERAGIRVIRVSKAIHRIRTG